MKHEWPLVPWYNTVSHHWVSLYSFNLRFPTATKVNMGGCLSRAEKHILLRARNEPSENTNSNKHNYIIDEVDHLRKNRISTSFIWWTFDYCSLYTAFFLTFLIDDMLMFNFCFSGFALCVNAHSLSRANLCYYDFSAMIVWPEVSIYHKLAP